MTHHIERKPQGIIYDINPDDSRIPQAKSWYSRALEGKWYRVMPDEWRDIIFLRDLTPYTEKCAPASGHGILISENAYKRMG